MVDLIRIVHLILFLGVSSVLLSGLNYVPSMYVYVFSIFVLYTSCTFNIGVSAWSGWYIFKII